MIEANDGALRVVVVEDDRRMLDILTRHLDRIGYSVRGSLGASQALQLLAQEPADVVITDVRMPGMDGRTLLQVIRETAPATRVVLMTAFGTVDDAVEAMKAGAYTYVCKPFKVEEIAAVLRNAAREVALGQQVDSLRRVLRDRWSADRLIGNSPMMQRVRTSILEAASVCSAVLITGRSGTGKEMAARAIHFEGPRPSRPFVPVNCAAVPESLFESAMFGHKKGAFTGAYANQIGFIEQANGGTLFLDEVAEIPRTHQAKLLRVLQEGELTPVGASRVIRVDIRLICATNLDLEAMIQAGTFREDLYYRINVLRLAMPSLQDRADDIPALCEHLLLAVAQEQGIPAIGFTQDAIESLKTHQWTGNVRELRNAIARALLSARGRMIDAADLPEAVRGIAPSPASQPAVVFGCLSLDSVEKAHIEKVLRMYSWNRSLAARVLGIDRRTLFSKIQRYGLVGPLRGTGDADDEASSE